jgi:hypothetical protein
MRIINGSWLGLVTVAVIALTVACGSEKVPTESAMEACEPSTERDCECDNGQLGTQTCRTDGLDYKRCECSNGAGGASGSAECSEEGQVCEHSEDCCLYPENSCVELVGEARCVTSCSSNAECESGCCLVLNSFLGICAAAESCGGEACRENGSSCDTAEDCCDHDTDAPESYCIDVERGGPLVCSARCEEAEDCNSGCCLKLDNGDSACFPQEDCES